MPPSKNSTFAHPKMQNLSSADITLSYPNIYTLSLLLCFARAQRFQMFQRLCLSVCIMNGRIQAFLNFNFTLMITLGSSNIRFSQFSTQCSHQAGRFLNFVFYRRQHFITNTENSFRNLFWNYNIIFGELQIKYIAQRFPNINLDTSFWHLYIVEPRSHFI